jgi:hypothetical protein
VYDFDHCLFRTTRLDDIRYRTPSSFGSKWNFQQAQVRLTLQYGICLPSLSNTVSESPTSPPEPLLPNFFEGVTAYHAGRRQLAMKLALTSSQPAKGGDHTKQHSAFRLRGAPEPLGDRLRRSAKIADAA